MSGSNGSGPVRSDLVNAHHALKRLSDASEPPTFAELRAISPVSKSRLKPILHMFKRRGILKESPEGRLVLVHAETTPDDLERMSRAYRERDERDRDKQRRMLGYADLRACRWDYLVNDFGKDDVESDACGHCDQCIPELFRSKAG